MKGINILNCLLTRKCNLKCGYCRISGDLNYQNKPDSYPNSSYYFRNEKDASWWIDFLEKFYNDNPNAFTILYGGEPLLYEGLIDIVNHLNSLNAYYTIISNCTKETDKLREKLFSETDMVRGFTASIDPCLGEKSDDDSYLKTHRGFQILKDIAEKYPRTDVVAEITCDNNTILKVEDTIRLLTKNNIWSDLTVLDIAKNNYYDFSAVTSNKMLVEKSEENKKVFDNLIKDDHIMIHAKNHLLPLIYDILPANLDCGLDKEVKNLTIDSDGSLRLCLRIKGTSTPIYNAFDIFDKEKEVRQVLRYDKDDICQGCSWTCMLMSNQLSNLQINEH